MPLLTSGEIAEIRAAPKPLPLDWRLKAWPSRPDVGCHRGELRIGRIEHPCGGALRIYTRQNLHDSSNFSTGVLLDADDGEVIPLMRCNGPYHSHQNRLERRTGGLRRVPVTPHVHHLTERYQTAHRKDPRVQPDGFAIGHQSWETLEMAMEALALRFNFYDGTMGFDAYRKDLP